MRRWALAVAGAALVVAGCSGTTGQSAPSASTAAPAPSDASEPSAPPTAPPTADPSGSAAKSACPAGQPAGTYRIKQFAGQSNSALGHGTGGDIMVTFRDGTYVMSSDGKDPMAMEVGDKAAGQLYMDGTITGTAGRSGGVRPFTVESAKGTAYVVNSEGRATVRFDQLAKVIGLDGKFAVACQGDRLALAGESAIFSLDRA
jgi:hypothetical protein